jgi:hypothetical protein
MLRPLARDQLLREIVEIACAARTWSRRDFAHSQADLLQTLTRHRLDALFYDSVHKQPTLQGLFSDEILDRLRDRTKQITAVTMLQEQAALRAAQALAKHHIPHVFYKAAHLRRLVYISRSLRPADDIDVIVRPEDHMATRTALLAAGFASVPKKSLTTHEETLAWHGAHVDLHWGLLRPGRARVDITHEVVAKGSELSGLCVPSIEHELVILLVGTALGDYVTARLIRAVDIDRLIRQTRPDWGIVLTLLQRMGLQTAAWATLAWTRSWFETPLAAEVWRELAPGRLRQVYLRAWLELDPWQVYMKRPTLARLGFSLALQQGGADVLRSVARRALASLRAGPQDSC